MILATAISEQAQVSDWPLRILLTSLTIAVIAFFFVLIARSWRRRAAGQQGLGELPEVPPEVVESIQSGELSTTEVRYIGTASAVNWNDKIAYQGLANRGFAQVGVHPLGVVIDRDGASTLFIPRVAIARVELAKGVAGRAFGGQGVVAVSWVQSGIQLDTGLRSSSNDVRQQLVAQISQLIQDGEQSTPQVQDVAAGAVAQKSED